MELLKGKPYLVWLKPFNYDLINLIFNIKEMFF